MLIRERYEQIEHQIYRPCASFSDETRGRDRAEDKCDMRTEYQRDRDRIILRQSHLDMTLDTHHLDMLGRELYLSLHPSHSCIMSKVCVWLRS